MVVIAVVCKYVFNLLVMRPNSTIHDKHKDNNIRYNEQIYTIKEKWSKFKKTNKILK